MVVIARPHRLGEAIRLLRERAGLKRDELAARLEGVSPGRLSDYESGKPQKYDIDALRVIVRALAESLVVDIEELWTEIMAIRDEELRVREAEREAEVLGNDI